MARTYKDRPSKVRFPEVYPYWVEVEKTKKRREQDTEWHWMGTPSWWTRLMMNKPQRRAGTIWESKFSGRDIEVEMLEEEDAPGVSKKPHQYFW